MASGAAPPQPPACYRSHRERPYYPYRPNSVVHEKPLLSFSQPRSLVQLSTNSYLLNRRPQPDRDCFPAKYSISFLVDTGPDSGAYSDVIESCKCLYLGTQLHAHALKSAFAGSRTFLETKLLSMYGRCGAFESALLLFDLMPERSIHSWVGVLSVCVEGGWFEEAVTLLEELQLQGVITDFFVFPVLLSATGGLGQLELGKQLHALIFKGGFVSNLYVENALICMYGKCGDIDDAIAVFGSMRKKDIISWNSIMTACSANGMSIEACHFLEKMRLSTDLRPNLISWSALIGGLSQNGYDKEALQLLIQMQDSGIEPNAQTLACVLPSCARLGILNACKEIHGYAVRHGFMLNSFVLNGLLDVYRRCADMESASRMYSQFLIRNPISINMMMAGYFACGEVDKARELFDHTDSIDARRDTISWNAMISGYAENEMSDDALSIFKLMVMEGMDINSFTLGSALSASADISALGKGKEIHSLAIVRGLHHDTIVNGALVDMYCKCQDLVSAELLFQGISPKDRAAWNALASGFARSNEIGKVFSLLLKMRLEGLEPDTFTWNGILAGYMENRHYELVVQLFAKMVSHRIGPDCYTITMLLSACTKLASIQRARQAHAYTIRCCLDSDDHVGTALVDLYSKCGYIRQAELLFRRILNKSLFCYNTLLAGFAMYGLGKKAISLFQELLANRLLPDTITFLSLISSCTHEGSVKEGFKYFNLMKDFEIEPDLKHYTCMVDLLSRAGFLDDAYKLIQKMPLDPDAVVWGALLSGCVMHRQVQLGEIAANEIIQLDKDNAGNYVNLANLYAISRRSTSSAQVRQIAKQEELQKVPGCSWIEDQNQIHVFVAGGRSHVQTKHIYETVEMLNLHMKEE